MRNERNVRNNLYNNVNAFLKKKIGARKSLDNIKQLLHSLYNNPIRMMRILKQKIAENLVQDNPEALSSGIYVIDSVRVNNLTPKQMLVKINQNEAYKLYKEDYLYLMMVSKYKDNLKGQDVIGNISEVQSKFNFFDGTSAYNGSTAIDGIKYYNDVSFYTTAKNDIHLAKMIKLRYKPISQNLIQEELQNNPTASEKLLYNNPNLYERSCSISFYSFLEGNPDKSHLIVRYDSTDFNHQNVWINDNDEKRTVFGDVAKSPHFHFQNEDDDLICLRKDTKGGQTIWQTGRCNAIDCEHLAEYLYELDNKEDYEIKQMVEDKKDYDMPFIYIKNSNKYLNFDVDKLVRIYSYNINEGGEGQKNMIYFNSFINDFLTDFNRSKFSKCDNNNVFSGFIKAIKLLEFLDITKKSVSDPEKLSVLNNFEVDFANNLFDKMFNMQKSHCKTKVNTKDVNYKNIEDREM